MSKTQWRCFSPLPSPLFQSQVEHSLMRQVASPLYPKWTACIVTSCRCHFARGLSNKKAESYYWWWFEKQTKIDWYSDHHLVIGSPLHVRSFVYNASLYNGYHLQGNNVFMCNRQKCCNFKWENYPMGNKNLPQTFFNSLNKTLYCTNVSSDLRSIH